MVNNKKISYSSSLNATLSPSTESTLIAMKQLQSLGKKMV